MMRDDMASGGMTLKDRVELVIFDWDGTVVDSTPTIVDAIRRACADTGIDVPSEGRASHVIGLGLKDAFAYLAPDLTDVQSARLLERFRAHYLARDHLLMPFAGMLDLLSGLAARGLPMAVATGKSRIGLERSFTNTGTRDFFRTSRCADESDPKPAPTMVLEICDTMGISPARALVIGDTTHDILMARSAGAACLAVTYGAHPAHELSNAGPLGCVHSVTELEEWMNQWIRN
jgi:phosphoglycolate phosphatase